jgi:hypothetical protein
MEAQGGRKRIAPTYSRPRHYVGVSGQRHAPAALYPQGKGPQYALDLSYHNLTESNQTN